MASGCMVLRVLYAANVLYSRLTRDWLLMLQIETSSATFVGCWTEDILAEVIYPLRRNHPAWDGALVALLRQRVSEVLEGGRIDRYACDVPYPGDDPNDRHVHAAAVAGGVKIVVSNDRGMMALGERADTPYDVMSADDFLSLVAESTPEAVLAVTQKQMEHAISRGRDSDLAARLEAGGLPGFGSHVRRALQNLALRR